MWFFTADQHFDHAEIINHCNRPFYSVEHMNNVLIKNWNEVVRGRDVVIIAGDFCWLSNPKIVKEKYIDKLNGSKIFLKGNHDNWYRKDKRYLYHKKINDQFIVISHYPFRTWNKSVHGSWNLHGHSHGNLEPLTNQLDIGVDCWGFYPVSFKQVKEKICTKIHMN